MNLKNDIVIAGGGLAGLTAAIHLLKAGLPVTLVEKNSYPQHKVCGEYISNEVLPYLDYLGLDLAQFAPTALNRFELSIPNRKTVSTTLPLGGFGISRYALDNMMYKHAVSLGCKVMKDTVSNISYEDGTFQVELGRHTALRAEIVIAAYGKRDQLDLRLSRAFFPKKSPWLAVKAHYLVDFPDDLITLYTFEGGYCGVSKVEKDVLNVCYLTDYRTFKKYRNIQDHRSNVLYEHEPLRKIFEHGTMLFEQPLTISQISFDNKKKVENHILMIGDSAGLIHPLCGNGMAMAIQSAGICADQVIRYHEGSISRKQMEKSYVRRWRQQFGKRMMMGKLLSSLLQMKNITGVMMWLVSVFPALLRFIIRQTHGRNLIIPG